jgi:hypothetical protein
VITFIDRGGILDLSIAWLVLARSRSLAFSFSASKNPVSGTLSATPAFSLPFPTAGFDGLEERE